MTIRYGPAGASPRLPVTGRVRAVIRARRVATTRAGAARPAAPASRSGGSAGETGADDVDAQLDHPPLGAGVDDAGHQDGRPAGRELGKAGAAGRPGAMSEARSRAGKIEVPSPDTAGEGFPFVGCEYQYCPVGLLAVTYRYGILKEGHGNALTIGAA